MTARLVSIQVGTPRDLEEPVPWRSSFYKEPVLGPVRLAATNLDGDRQADLNNHGGPDMTVLCYSADHYPEWHRQLGFEMPHGGFGENFTIEGLDEWSTCIGDVYEIGEVRVQVSQPRGPCYKISYRWGIPDLLDQVTANQRSGWYLRVLAEGMVEAGSPLEVVERPNPEWTVNRAYRAEINRNAGRDEIAGLAACGGLAPKLRRKLEALLARP